ncbi:MAG: transposase, partial [Dolichospermum sp.]
LCAIEEQKWNIYQQKRAKLLFDYYPELKEAYYQILAFRHWYKAKPPQYEPFQNERLLGNWLDELENSPINELANFRNLVINHEPEILNYHKHGNKTNAIAESINARISDANRKNNGTKDINFFNYRLAFII